MVWYLVTCDKPRNGYVYVCYKLAKTKYRQACRLAFNERLRSSFYMLNFLYTINNSKKFLNTVRKCRRATNDPSSDIALSSLVKYYSEKFSMMTAKSQTILAPAADVITAEHLIYSADSDIVRHITKMLTLCVQFGVVPDNFTNGLSNPHTKESWM